MTALDDETLIRRFLLGEPSQSEREHTEERMFMEEAFFAQVDAIEDELIDDYVHDKLGAKERKEFKEHFLVTLERQERLEFALDFQRALTESHLSIAKPATVRLASGSPFGFWIVRRRWLAVSFATVLFLLFSAVAFLWFGSFRAPRQEVVNQPSPVTSKEKESIPDKDVKRPEPGVIQAANKDAVPDTAGPGKRPKPSGNQVSRFAIVLVPGAARSGGEGIKQFSLPASAKRVALKLFLDSGDEQAGTSFEAELQSADGRPLLKAGNLSASSTANGTRFVRFNVPGARLPAGDYQIALRPQASKENSGTATRYYFRVLDGADRRRPK